MLTRPTAMAVEFALFQHDDLLCRSAIRIAQNEQLEEFDVASPGAPARLVIRHRFGLPAASLGVKLIEYKHGSDSGEVILEAGLAMGVHDSDDWESVGLGADYTFAFRCRQEPQPAT